MEVFSSKKLKYLNKFREKKIPLKVQLKVGHLIPMQNDGKNLLATLLKIFNREY